MDPPAPRFVIRTNEGAVEVEPLIGALNVVGFDLRNVLPLNSVNDSGQGDTDFVDIYTQDSGGTNVASPVFSDCAWVP